ncbi:MAG: DivIVA domain-containing protein [Bacillota bacterium]
MPLTPLDLQSVQFKKSWRGYSCDQVDSFLHKALRDYEMIYKENLELKENLINIQSLLDTYRQMEDTLKNTLVLAQKSAEEIRRLADQEAELLLREAKAQAENIKTCAAAQVEERMRRYEEMVNRAEAFRANMRGFLLAQLELWEQGRQYYQEAAAGLSSGGADCTG